MKVFLKYTGLAIALQLLMIVAAIALADLLPPAVADYIVMPILFIYLPTILFISSVETFTGCANMVEPFIQGVPLGIFLYSLSIGSIIYMFKRPGRLP